MTGVMPVAGRRAKSWAITMAPPRRKPYGEATIRAMRMGMSDASRPTWSRSIRAIGSGRLSAGRHAPSELRETFCRRRRPSSRRLTREIGRTRTD